MTLYISFMYTAVPAISRALRETPATSVWVVNAYHLALVAAVVPLAALGEAIGHRRVHVAGALERAVLRHDGTLRRMLAGAPGAGAGMVGPIPKAGDAGSGRSPPSNRN